MTEIKLHYLRYFLTLAEEQHFGRAASRLGIAQPALSQQIQRLERIVGHTLLQRRPRVELTEAGHALLPVARHTLQQVEEGLDATRRAARGETGTLTVGFAASVMLTELAAAMQVFRRRFPDVDLQLRELSTAAQLEALRAGTIDLGFLREPADVDDSLIAEPILREPFAVALPPKHVRRARQSLKLELLADEPFVLFPREVAPGLHERVLSMCRASGFAPRVVQEAHEWLTIVALVDAGLGVSLVPASFEKLHWGDVTYRRVGKPATRTTISLGKRREGVPAAAKSFAAVVREVVRDT